LHLGGEGARRVRLVLVQDTDHHETLPAVHAVFHRAGLHPTREAHAALIEEDEPGEFRPPFAELAVTPVIPVDVEVGDVALDEDQVAGSAADRLLGDVDVAVPRVPDRHCSSSEGGGRRSAGQGSGTATDRSGILVGRSRWQLVVCSAKTATRELPAAAWSLVDRLRAYSSR
jgi:hypothetical protein